MVSDSTGVMSTGVVSTGVVSSGVVSTGVVSAGVFSGVVIFVVSVSGMVFETEVLMKLEDSLVDTLLELVDPEVTEVVETEEVSREVPEDEV